MSIAGVPGVKRRYFFRDLSAGSGSGAGSGYSSWLREAQQASAPSMQENPQYYADKAATDTAIQGERQLSAQNRNMQAMGIDPSSSRYQAIQRNARTALAAAKAGGANAAYRDIVGKNMQSLASAQANNLNRLSMMSQDRWKAAAMSQANQGSGQTTTLGGRSMPRATPGASMQNGAGIGLRGSALSAPFRFNR